MSRDCSQTYVRHLRRSERLRTRDRRLPSRPDTRRPLPLEPPPIGSRDETATVPPIGRGMALVRGGQGAGVPRTGRAREERPRLPRGAARRRSMHPALPHRRGRSSRHERDVAEIAALLPPSPRSNARARTSENTKAPPRPAAPSCSYARGRPWWPLSFRRSLRFPNRPEYGHHGPARRPNPPRQTMRPM